MKRALTFGYRFSVGKNFQIKIQWWYRTSREGKKVMG